MIFFSQKVFEIIIFNKIKKNAIQEKNNLKKNQLATMQKGFHIIFFGEKNVYHKKKIS